MCASQGQWFLDLVHFLQLLLYCSRSVSCMHSLGWSQELCWFMFRIRGFPSPFSFSPWFPHPLWPVRAPFPDSCGHKDWVSWSTSGSGCCPAVLLYSGALWLGPAPRHSCQNKRKNKTKLETYLLVDHFFKFVSSRIHLVNISVLSCCSLYYFGNCWVAHASAKFTWLFLLRSQPIFPFVAHLCPRHSAIFVSRAFSCKKQEREREALVGLLSERNRGSLLFFCFCFTKDVYTSKERIHDDSVYDVNRPSHRVCKEDPYFATKWHFDIRLT